MTQSDMELWIKNMRGLFNRFLLQFENIADGHAKGLDKGVKGLADQTRREIAASVNLSVTDAEGYITTSVGMFMSHVKQACIALPLVANDLKQVHPPSKECQMVQRDLEKAIMSLHGDVRSIMKGVPTPSRIQLAKAASFFIVANEMQKSALNRFISLGGSIP